MVQTIQRAALEAVLRNPVMLRFYAVMLASGNALVAYGSRQSVALATEQRGNVQTRIISIVAGVITLVIGIVLADVIISTAATQGADANIGSFSGAKSLNDLVPLVYYAAVVMLGVGMIGIGAAGFAGRGPMSDL